MDILYRKVNGTVEDTRAVCPRRRRQSSRHGIGALLGLMFPALGLPLGLLLLRAHPRFSWLHDWRAYPWEFWTIGCCGSIATLAGLADWLCHRSGTTVVGHSEHRAHLAALVGGGVPLFILMALASCHEQPAAFLVPVLVVLIYTVVMICYDEFIFHRRCGLYEQCTHRLLTFGNSLAFLAWAHWCFGGRSGW